MDQEPESAASNKKTFSAVTVVALILLIILVAAGVWAIFLRGDGSELQTDSDPAGGTPSPSSQQTQLSQNETAQNIAATITYTEDGFSPQTTTVKVGDTVKLINNSSRPMQFDSDPHPVHTNDPELNQSTLSPGGDSLTFTVTEPGTHGYHDHLNSSKTGTLIVKE